jgi:hypothetical protein
MSKYNVTIIEPTRIAGEHKGLGEVVELDENEAYAVVAAGRGTIDPDRANAAIAAGEANRAEAARAEAEAEKAAKKS